LNSNKNVLLITYYWPPSGGAGVHRWLRFSKYFTQQNINLTVYCPSQAAWPIIDEELHDQIPSGLTVIRRKIFEPHKFLGKSNSKGVGFTENKKRSLIQKFIVWVRGNLFIPDSRIFWIRPSTRFLSKYLKEHPEINTIISTGPPHSMHLIANNLKKKHNFRWLADFRDPWTQIDFYHDLLPGRRADRKHRRLEKLCLTNSDEVITISDSCSAGLKKIVDREIHVITNGYDFPEFDSNEIILDNKFTISHFGSMPFTRNPLVLWKALSELISENSEFREHLCINLVGIVDYKVIDSAIENGLKEFMSVIPPVKHSKSIALQRTSQLLLLAANNTGNVKGILTGKFFEYLGAKRPIIAIGMKNSDLEVAMKTTNGGFFSDFNDKLNLKESLEASFRHYQSRNLFCQAVALEQFNSKNLASKFIELL